MWAEVYYERYAGNYTGEYCKEEKQIPYPHFLLKYDTILPNGAQRQFMTEGQFMPRGQGLVVGG